MKLLKGKTMAKEILTAKELAERFHVRPGTISRWASKGIIPCLRPTSQVVRFEWESVLNALEKRQKGEQRDE